MTVYESYAFLDKKAPANAVIDRIPQGTFPPKDGSLSGVPFAIKNNICLKDFRLTCGSRMLEKYISPYTATAVIQLMDAGAIPVCTANLDEFGMGSTGENSAWGPVENPAVSGYCTGGSSSGCAALVASGCVPLALASDTGGSARLPAAYCGVLGMKPTYGAYSRFGLTAYASSLEQIGLISNDLPLMRKAHVCLSKEKDPLDTMHTGINPISKAFTFDNHKIAVLSTERSNIDAAIVQAVHNAANLMKAFGADLIPASFDRPHLISPAYYVIACAEASANLARFTGMLTVNNRKNNDALGWEERFSESRALLGAEVQKRIALGTYVLREGYYEQYYLRAQQYRGIIKHWFATLFKECALLLLPTAASPAPALHHTNTDDSLCHYHGDMWTACANLAGLPAISIPWGRDKNGCPIAIQLIAPAGHDEWLFDAAEILIRAGEAQ